MKRLVVLISGRGSNLQAILAGRRAGQVRGEVVAVVSNRADAAGLALARTLSITTIVVERGGFADKARFDAALSAAIDDLQPDLVVLAGFMYILSDGFVLRYTGRLINIHPSLLPAYPGLATHRRALADGVKVHGCTVHFVTGEIDRGPIVAQAAVPVLPDDDEATLAARVLAAEHVIYPQAIAWFCDDRLTIDGSKVRVKDWPIETGTLLVPSARPMA